MSPSVSQPVHVNSATGIVGPTGAGKSALIGTAAEYLADTYPGQVLALYTADGGGFPTKVQSLVRLGIIRVWRMRTRGEAFETTMRASAGWWPSAINPSTGETKPHVRLVPPITERYTMRCPNAHVVKVVAFQNLLTPTLCPTCKTHTTRENMTVEKSAIRTKGFEPIGAVAFDGLTSFLNWQMTDMARRTATMELKGEETALGGRIVSGDIALGGNNRAHYGFVQGRAEEMVLNSLGIPGLALPPIWTGLMLETVDEGGLSVRGMKLAGKAKTDECGAWFGNMLEIGVVKDEHGNNVRRLSLEEFVDDAGARHLIKHRGGPSMPPFLQDVHGEPWGQVNLGLFFDLLAKDIDKGFDEATERYKTAPGMPEGEVSYGETNGSSEKPVEAPKPATGKLAPPLPRKAAPKPAQTVAAEPAAATGPIVHTGAAEPDAQTGPETLAEVAAAEIAQTPHSSEKGGVGPTTAPSVRSAPPVRPSVAAAPRPGMGGKPFSPPPAPRPPARAPQVPGLLPRS